MKKLFNIKKLYIKILVIIFGIYVISVLINQQSKLNGYKESQAYYQEKANEAKKYQEELDLLNKIKSVLEQGKSARTIDFTDEEKDLLKA